MAISNVTASISETIRDAEGYILGEKGNTTDLSRGVQLIEQLAKRHLSPDSHACYYMAWLYDENRGNDMSLREWLRVGGLGGNRTQAVKFQLWSYLYPNNTSTSSPKMALVWYSSAAKMGTDDYQVDAHYQLGLRLISGKDIEKNISLARDNFQVAGSHRHVDAQYQLGHIHETGGPEVPCDLELARNWYNLAALKGHPDAQCKLGLLLETGGHSVTPNLELAMHWYRIAAAQGHPDGQYLLGLCLSKNGVASNAAEIRKLFYSAAMSGHPKAKGALLDYVDEWDSPPFMQAFQWYVEAAIDPKRNAEIPYQLGLCLEKGGEGVMIDKVSAQQWFSWVLKIYDTLAEQGDGSALYKKGMCYKHGRGTAQNLTEAERCFGLAAAKGHIDANCQLNLTRYELSLAHYKLGLHYMKEVPPNLAEAERCFRGAARTGHVEAEYQLGLLYVYQANQMLEKAKQCLTKAAEKGHPTAPARFIALCAAQQQYTDS